MIDKYRFLLLILGAGTIPLFFLPLTPEDPFLVPKQVLLAFIASGALIVVFYPLERFFKNSSGTLLFSSLFFLICIAVSFMASSSFYLAFTEWKRWAYLLVLFLTASQVNWSYYRLRLFLKISVAVSGIIAASVILEYLELIPFYLYPFDTGRIHSFFGYQNITAQYLLVPALWGIGLIISSSNMKSKIMAIIFIFLPFTALILTFCRGAIISAVMGGILLFYLYRKAYNAVSLSRRKYILITVILTALAAQLWLWNHVADGTIIRHILFMFERRDSYRLSLWQDALEVFYNSPFIGVGLGNYKISFFEYVHNAILHMLVETGVIGISGFIVFLFFAFKSSIQKNDYYPDIEYKILKLAVFSGCIATLWHSMVSFNLQSAASSYFFFVGLGILCSRYSENADSMKTSKNKTLLNIIVLSCVSIIALWSMHSEYKKIMGHYSFNQALIAFRSNDTAESLDYSLNAIRYQPYNAKYYRLAGKIYRKTGQSKSAKTYFRKSEELSPYLLNNSRK